MSSKYSLSDMPEVVMNIILGKVNFGSIFTLRKVCQSLRYFIDYNRPEIQFNSIDITLGSNRISANWMFETDYFHIEYQKHENGCLIQLNEKEKLVENMDFFNGFCNDFDIIIRHQKSKFHRFHFNSCRSSDESIKNQILERLEKILKKCSLRIECLHIGVIKQSEIMSILPFFNANNLKEESGKNSHLKEISIFNTTYMNRELELEEIVELDQWKTADELNIRNFIVSAPIQHFTHFSKINVPFFGISSQDLFLLKEAALESSKTIKHTLGYTLFYNEDQLNDLFGHLNLISDGINKKEWSFKRPKSEEVLKIAHYPKFNRIHFSIVSLLFIPPNALNGN